MGLPVTKGASHRDVPALLPIVEAKLPKGLKVLAAGGDPDANRALVNALADVGCEPVAACSVHEAVVALTSNDIAVVFCANELADGTCRDFFRALNLMQWKVPVVITARLGGWDEYLQAMELGAFDFIVPPYRRGEIGRIVRNALGMAFSLRA